MKNKLVVVTDLGSLKAYKLDRNDFGKTQRLELLEDITWPDAHEKLTDMLSDSAGRYGQSGAPGASVGERHNIVLEHRRRLVRQLANHINTLLRPADVEACYLAASKEINHQILDALEPAVRAKIQKNIAADLTKLGKKELLERFMTAD